MSRNMKKSIIQRATEYAQGFNAPTVMNALREGYIAGAIEQMEIDATEMEALNKEWMQNMELQKALLSKKRNNEQERL